MLMKAGVQSTHIFCRGDLFSYSGAAGKPK